MGHHPNWSNDSGAAGRSGAFGSNWTLTQAAYLASDPSQNTVSVVLNGVNSLTFIKNIGGTYDLLGPTKETLEYDNIGLRFTLTDTTGRVLTFYDYDVSLPAIQQGQLETILGVNGLESDYTYDGDGRLTDITRKLGTTWETLVFTYGGTGVNSDRVTNVVLKSSIDSGSTWLDLRQVEYSYYGIGQSFGTPGDLKLASVKDMSGNTIETSYYRYFEEGESGGYAGALKFAVGTAAFNRMLKNYFSIYSTDAEIATIADTYFEYGDNPSLPDYRKVLRTAQAGGTVAYDYAYTDNTGYAGTDPFNEWKTKAVETKPDGSTRTVFTNFHGQVMMTVLTETGGSPRKWIDFYRYDGDGRLLYHANPSAMRGYDEGINDLVEFVSSTDATYIRDNAGLLEVYTYGSSTTATNFGSSYGDVAGYLKTTALRMGETGTDVKQADLLYRSRATTGATTYWMSSSSVYRDTAGTIAQTTKFAYAWVGSTQQLLSMATTLPTIVTGQNGSNSPVAASEVVFDAAGRPVWMKDATGIIDYTEYDPATGGVVKMIRDVDTSITADYLGTAPWSSSGTELRLIRTFEVDKFGRTTAAVDPMGTSTYTLYFDAVHASFTYADWNTTTDTPTGPTVVYYDNLLGGYTDSFTMSSAPAVVSGRPTGGESLTGVQSLTRTYYDLAGRVSYVDEYFDFSGLAYGSLDYAPGTQNVNFYRTEYGYDAKGRLDRVVNPAGTITRTVYDQADRVISTWVGTDDTPTSGFWSPANDGGTNLKRISITAYDGGGVGDGNVTSSTLFPTGATDPRVTETYFDWRNRPVAGKSGVETSEATDVNRPIWYTEYDNLDQPIVSEKYDGDAVTITSTAGVPNRPSSSLLRAKSVTSYDDLGRGYKTETFAVDPSSGSVSSYALTAKSWYDDVGRLLKQTQPGGLVQKIAYDRIGRISVSYATDGGGDSGYSDADNVTGDTVLTQDEYLYDANGNVIQTTHRDRFHDASGTGALGTPGSGVTARVSFMGYYYDLGNRLTDSVNVGTNGGSAWTRPGSVPTRSDTELVNSTGYDAAGRPWETTDAMGVVYRTYFDMLGRTTQTIENYISMPIAPTTSQNKTTDYRYGPAGLAMVRALQGSTYQETEYLYGVTVGGGSAVNSNDIVGVTQWPDATTGTSSSSEQETVTVNASGEVLTITDRNGTTHTYTRDILGRIVADAVTTLGSGVDGSVRLITTEYDGQGNPFRITSYDAVSSGNIVNQVERAYNGLGQMTDEWQQHGAAVNTGTSPRVQYTYSTLDANNRSRLVSMTYPSGYVVDYNYGSGLNDAVSRIDEIASGGSLEAYSYLGWGTVVRGYKPAGISYIGSSPGDAGDQYAGLDRFGRTVRQTWSNGGSTPYHEDLTYTYDRNSNRLMKTNLLNSSFDESYTYDELNQLLGSTRGADSKDWAYDSLGNRTSVTTNGGTPDAWTSNAQNEITGIGSASAPTYDANGNMLTDEIGRVFTYDAWNRLVSADNGTTAKSYTYDGLFRRVTESNGTDTIHRYYSDQWQLLEEYLNTNKDAEARYVWSPVYVDALMLRERTISGSNPGIERLWAVSDANFNVTALVDDNANVVERYVYDPYGAVTIYDGIWSNTLGSSAYAWTVLFQGMAYDDVAGLYGSRYRSGYSPTLGKWISVDPIRFAAGDVNLSRFVANNPGNSLDPSGLESLRYEGGGKSSTLLHTGGGWSETAQQPSGAVPPKLPDYFGQLMGTKPGVALDQWTTSQIPGSVLFSRGLLLDEAVEKYLYNLPENQRFDTTVFKLMAHGRFSVWGTELSTVTVLDENWLRMGFRLGSLQTDRVELDGYFSTQYFRDSFLQLNAQGLKLPLGGAHSYLTLTGFARWDPSTQFSLSTAFALHDPDWPSLYGVMGISRDGSNHPYFYGALGQQYDLGDYGRFRYGLGVGPRENGMGFFATGAWYGNDWRGITPVAWAALGSAPVGPATTVMPILPLQYNRLESPGTIQFGIGFIR